jgi:hypothetical protein
MLQPKSVSVFGAFAMIALAVGAGPAEASIIFGGTGVGPTPACGAQSGPGQVCAITEVFNNGTDNIIANGFSGAPAAGTGNANLTLKPLAAPFNNSFMESGLGTNANAGPACSDPDSTQFRHGRRHDHRHPGCSHRLRAAW